MGTSKGCRRVLLQGNEAIAEGAIAAGVRLFAGYPITPSSEIAETMSRRLPEVGGVYLQMEDEMASIAVAIGASIAGLKVMDATSGPGFSLKQENLGFAIFAEIPLVLVDVQRVGPSSGMATLPAQGDVMQARWGTHGDHPIIALSPHSVRECFDVTVRAVNLAEKYRTPVIVLADGVVGHMREIVELPDYDEIEKVDRKGPSVPPAEYLPYRPGKDLVPEFASFGKGYHWYVNSSMHGETGFSATSDHAWARKLLRRLHDKIDSNKADIVDFEEYMVDDAEIVLVSFGAAARSAKAAVRRAREKGIRAGLFRLITVWPFPEEEIARLSRSAKAMLVVEMNMGQLYGEVRKAVRREVGVHLLGWTGGELVTPTLIVEKLEEVIECGWK